MNKVMEYMALGKPIVQFDMTESRISAQDASIYAKLNISVDLAEKLQSFSMIQIGGNGWANSAETVS